MRGSPNAGQANVNRPSSSPVSQTHRLADSRKENHFIRTDATAQQPDWPSVEPFHLF
ncbi:MAG: hypothetical protein HOA45_05420 [Verrucomicrobia bacterium]|nr:hypothetical protein [Verrucomicrobiota bacterium]